MYLYGAAQYTFAKFEKKLAYMLWYLSLLISHFLQLVTCHAFKGGGLKPPDSTPAVDYQTVSQAQANIIAGCCMAMGLRYAGTCDPDAFECLVGVRGY